MWNTFECETIEDYLHIYNTTDVLILADVFENFRNICQETYQLEPLHYYSLPGFSWDAALKYSGEKVDLIKDLDMYLMIKKAMRGGICTISHRKAEANQPTSANFDPLKPESYLMYLDANGLYAWAMTQPLPLNGFQWHDPNSFDLSMLGSDKGKGYILEIDCEIPEIYHDKLNVYPPAPEKMKVTKDLYSPLQKKMGCKEGNVEKLIPNLLPKSKYVVHHRLL